MGTIIKRDSLSKQVSDKLESMIAEGKYPVGERIPTEPELMEIFEVSRNTIREAVQSLTWAGILEVKQGDGTYVRTANRFHANMKKQYAKASLDDIHETRNCLEVTIAHLAALRHNEEDIHKIKDALVKRNTDLKDSKENTKADLEFHVAIAQASHNMILIDLYNSISEYLENHIAERRAESRMPVAKIDALHEQLYREIVERNPDAASKTVQSILDI